MLLTHVCVGAGLVREWWCPGRGTLNQEEGQELPDRPWQSDLFLLPSFFSGSWLVMCHVTGVLLLSCCHIHQAHGHDPARWCSMKPARSSLTKYARSSSPKPRRWGTPDPARRGPTKHAKSSPTRHATMKRCAPDSAQWGMPGPARWNMQDPS